MMRQIQVNEDRTIIFDGQRCLATWSQECAFDIKMFHAISFIDEVARILVTEIDFEFQLSNEEKEYCYEEIRKHLK